jgi:hypothetical protein
MFSIQDIRARLERDYTAVVGTVHEEVHRFVSWLEGRQTAIDAAKKLLEDDGYTVSKGQ